jgi:hypothetical protein
MLARDKWDESEGGDVDYYEYISDSKVDMLLPQVTIALKQKMAIEIGVDFKIFSAKASTEHTTLEDRVSRVKIVARHLKATETLGSIATHKPWIEDQKVVKCGFVGQKKEIIVFCGSDSATCFMLAGSSGHLIGRPPNVQEVELGFSFAPKMLERFEWANRMLEENMSNKHIRRAVKARVKQGGSSSEAEETNARNEYLSVLEENVADIVSARRGGRLQNWEDIVAETMRQLDGPLMEVEFLAKRLLYIDEPIIGGRLRTILATPLFIIRRD